MSAVKTNKRKVESPAPFVHLPEQRATQPTTRRYRKCNPGQRKIRTRIFFSQASLGLALLAFVDVSCRLMARVESTLSPRRLVWKFYKRFPAPTPFLLVGEMIKGRIQGFREIAAASQTIGIRGGHNCDEAHRNAPTKCGESLK